MRLNKETSWNSLSLKQIDEELKITGLKRVKRFFMIPCISETIIILAKKLDYEIK